MNMPEWPRPPIRAEDLPEIRELLSPEEYEKLLRRIEAQKKNSPPDPPNLGLTMLLKIDPKR